MYLPCAYCLLTMYLLSAHYVQPCSGTSVLTGRPPRPYLCYATFGTRRSL